MQLDTRIVLSNKFFFFILLTKRGQCILLYCLEMATKFVLLSKQQNKIKVNFLVFKNSLISNYHRSEVIQLYYYYQIL